MRPGSSPGPPSPSSPGSSPGSSLAALLMTNRLVDVGVRPLAASEYWSVLGQVQDPAVMLGASASVVTELVSGDTALAERLVTLLDAVAAFVFERERLADEGITMLSSFDEGFPRRLLERLDTACPAFLTVAGPATWLSSGGLGVVGSRDASADACAVAQAAARVAVAADVAVISGLARGIDQAAMASTLDLAGAVIGVPAEGLQVAARSPEVRRRVHAGELCIASPYAPGARFTAGNALGRNKLIYGLADATLVVCSAHGTGGTWGGATESLRRSFGPVVVWMGGGAGPGNAALATLGATTITDVAEVLDAANSPPPTRAQDSLF